MILFQFFHLKMPHPVPSLPSSSSRPSSSSPHNLPHPKLDCPPFTTPRISTADTCQYHGHLRQNHTSEGWHHAGQSPQCTFPFRRTHQSPSAKTALQNAGIMAASFRGVPSGSVRHLRQNRTRDGWHHGGHSGMPSGSARFR